MNHLGVFAKYWQPGAVKTRLARSIGPESASRLYQMFVEVTLNRFASVGDRRQVVYTPPERRHEFIELAGPAWQLSPQAGGDLGNRMRRFFTDNLDLESGQRVVLIGSDSPHLPTAYVEQAFDRLQRHPVVLGPSEDGGYYLIGIRESAPNIFRDIAWSSPDVFEQTATALRTQGIPYATLEAWYDIDHLEDLQRLQQDLHQAADADLERLAVRLSRVLEASS